MSIASEPQGRLRGRPPGPGRPDLRGKTGIRPGAAGFTLIEILIAILILAIVLSTVHAAYRETFRIIRTVDYDRGIYDMGRTTLERMMKDLGAITPYRGKYELTAGRSDPEEGGFTTLSFTSAANLVLNDQDSPPGVSTISYDVVRDLDREGYVLLRTDDRRRETGREKERRQGFVLCDRLHSIGYTFYDAAGTPYPTWNSAAVAGTPRKEGAPTVVAIELKLVNPDDRERPHAFLTKVYLPITQVEREESPL